jgi:hypothetical protein
MEFLYSLNRLNVATSRARSMSILVSSPLLFEAECRTPRQIQLANAFCRYLEMADTITASANGNRTLRCPVDISRSHSASSQLTRRAYRQLQHLAQCRQVCIAWPRTIGFPEVNAGLTDTDLLGNFSDRQTTLDPCVAKEA